MRRGLLLLIILIQIMGVGHSRSLAQPNTQTSVLNQTGYLVVGDAWQQRLLKWDLATQMATEVFVFQDIELPTDGLTAEEVFSEREIQAIYQGFADYPETIEALLSRTPRSVLNRVWQLDDSHLIFEIQYWLHEGISGIDLGFAEYGIWNLTDEDYTPLHRFDFQTNSHVTDTQFRCTLRTASIPHATLIYEQSLFRIENHYPACLDAINREDFYTVLIDLSDLNAPQIIHIPLSANVMLSPDKKQILFYRLEDCFLAEDIGCSYGIRFDIGYADIMNIDKSFQSIQTGFANYRPPLGLQYIGPLAWIDDTQWVSFSALYEGAPDVYPFEYDNQTQQMSRLDLASTDIISDFPWYIRITNRYIFSHFPDSVTGWPHKATDQLVILKPDSSLQHHLFTVITNDETTYEFDMGPFLAEGEHVLDISLVTE